MSRTPPRLTAPHRGTRGASGRPRARAVSRVRDTPYRETAGTGAPVVLLHGWGMNLRVFDALAARLARHYAVTALDLPGHGASPWPAGCTPGRQLQLIARSLPRGATLIGWSLGGQLALALAARPVLAVQRLVLIASTPRFVQSEDWPHGLPADTLRQFSRDLGHDSDATVARFLELQVRGSLGSAATLAALRAALARHGAARPPALRAGLALLAQTDLRALAPALSVPTLLVAGASDRITPPGAARALAALLPDARLLELPRAGHAPFLSHEEAVAEAALRFLAEPPRRLMREPPPLSIPS